MLRHVSSTRTQTHACRPMHGAEAMERNVEASWLVVVCKRKLWKHADGKLVDGLVQERLESVAVSGERA